MVSNAHVLSARSPDLRDIITRHASGVPEINLYVVYPPSPGWLEAPQVCPISQAILTSLLLSCPGHQDVVESAYFFHPSNSFPLFQ